MYKLLLTDFFVKTAIFIYLIHLWNDMETKINLKDRRILYELDRNCRQSNAQIAKKVGLSKQVVNYRINKLQEEGIIQKHITLLNVLKLGFLPYRVLLQFQNMSPDKESRIIRHLQDNANINWIASCFGRWDLTFVFTAKTILEFNKNLNEALKPYESLIKEKESLLMTDLYQFTRNYLINGKEKTSLYFGGDPDETKLDNMDLKIIGVLSENARENIVVIAKKLNTTVDIVRYRIKKLIDNNLIQSFRSIINREVLGYQHWNILIKTQSLNEEKEKQFISFLKEVPNVIYVTKYVNDFNIGFELEVKNMEELHGILTELRYKFSDVIKSYETVLFFREHKITYIPKL